MLLQSLLTKQNNHFTIVHLKQKKKKKKIGSQKKSITYIRQTNRERVETGVAKT